MLLANSIFGTPTEASVADDTETTDLSDDIVFPHDEVIDVNIVITDEDYQYLLDNAMDEVYVNADITYNGYTLSNVAIRAKGNSSLRDVYNAGGDRFSFKVDLNYYIDGQDLFGIDKLNLNNLFMDPSMMAEYIGYEMFDSLDAISSRTTFAALYINGEYYGLYLSVENIDSEFLEDNFDDSEGYLYKPEMGTGADLSYVSDDPTDYTGLFPTNYDDYTNDSILELITAIENGDELDEIFDVDQFLKYLAISTYTVHMDSYQGGMFHNYYLYNNDGVYEWLPWDLNMTFNGFPGFSLSDELATQMIIDEPTSSALSNYPIIESVLANEEYLETYHEYLQELIDNYADEDTFNDRVLEIYQMINNYVANDSNSFYSYTEFENALFADTTSSLTGYIEARNESVESQLAGLTESTNDGLGAISASTDTPTDGPGGNDRPTRPVGDLPTNNNNQDEVVNVGDEVPNLSQEYLDANIAVIIFGVVGTIGASTYLALKKY